MATAADSVITTNNYLYLPNDPFQWNLPEGVYITYLPPTNSSGDIYHMVSYLMLAEYEKKTLPMIQLSYDGNATSKKNESEMNTYSQTQRCIQFAKHLGFEKCFLNPIKLPGSGFRSNPRQKKLLNYLKNNIISKGRVYFVEQKLLTTLISHYFIEN
ncbi:unnamed protein product, partial [Rotaria sp. Silwood2]